MTASELETWLKSAESEGAGWTREGGSETIGHESGGKIVKILKSNPGKDPEGYAEGKQAHFFLCLEEVSGGKRRG